MTTRHEPTATVSGCDSEDEEADDYLVIFCCEEHGRFAQSVCGSNVEFPNDGAPYALVVGHSFYSIDKELSGQKFAVKEGA